MLFVNKVLDLNEYKKLYVKERILDGKYEKLPVDKANNVFKISGFGSLDKEGYEHGFLYLKDGSSILEHFHDNDIEIYRIITNNKLNDSICLLGDSHKIDSVSGDTIIETFKVNKDIIKDNYDIDTLNKYLQVQAFEYLWRIDNLLVKLSYHPDDLYYSSFEELSNYYQLSLDSIINMYKIYFYKDENLPYKDVPVNLSDFSFDSNYMIHYKTLVKTRNSI